MLRMIESVTTFYYSFVAGFRETPVLITTESIPTRYGLRVIIRTLYRKLTCSLRNGFSRVLQPSTYFVRILIGSENMICL